MPRIGIRITEELHAELKTIADIDGVSVSDFVRQAVENEMLDRRTASNGISRESLTILKQQIESLKDQLQTKDDQISQLHQLVAMSQKHSDDLTKQLEDHRQRRSWWYRRVRKSG